MDHRRYLTDLRKLPSKFDQLHYTCLLYQDNVINDSILVTLVHNLFVDDNYLDWIADPDSIRRFANRICQREV